MNASDALEEVAATVSEDGSFIEAQITRLGTYAVCKMLDGEADVDVEEIPSDEKDDAITDAVIMPGKVSVHWIWIAIAIVEAVAVVGYIGYRIYKKRI